MPRAEVAIAGQAALISFEKMSKAHRGSKPKWDTRPKTTLAGESRVEIRRSPGGFPQLSTFRLAERRDQNGH